MVAYYTVQHFRVGGHQRRRGYSIRRSGRYPLAPRAASSRDCLLEQTASCVRVHALDGIGFQYYIGQHVPPMLNLYGGKYDFSPFDLAEMPPAGRKVSLYVLNGGHGADHWIEPTAA